ENHGWLDDYALFSVLSDHFGSGSWDTWPETAKHRDRDTLSLYTKKFAEELEREKFHQYIFFLQWHPLRKYCNDRKIRVIGDLPIYAGFDSADVWAHQELFQLDKSCRPLVVAGVPPDYFSRTGQIWSNPLYRWDEHERTGFSWWTERFRHTFSLYDLVRIDHFRGLVAYYEIPPGATDATGGRWVQAPARSFFQTMMERFSVFPVIAEDLGVITPDVIEIMRTYCLPGMRVLQFAFTDETPSNPHAPHNLRNIMVFYTGTHDNAPTRAWFEHYATADDKRRLSHYLGREYTARELPDVFIRLAMMSVADTCIIPLQDLLALGDNSRMNTPGTEVGNWEWRVTQDQLHEDTATHLRHLTQVYGRL
ncbi:MAG TPA: 4-alpha-glucanotransferase, partial [Methanoregula sp.]|nr:4-alpha-glucanotransferase [Methanoregula sp.]